MNNLEIWDKVREVPKEAIKPINGGRLKGMSDINPVWRIKTLTEQFGMCGFGWKYEIMNERLEEAANGEITAFVRINLYVKVDNEWSAAIPGTGGNSFVAKESAGLRTSDECFKMALTDALSVACKALGIGADVYWAADKSKYGDNEQTTQPQNQPTQQPSQQPQKTTKPALSDKQVSRLWAIAKSANVTEATVREVIKKDYNKEHIHDLTKTEYDKVCERLETKIKQSA